MGTPSFAVAALTALADSEHDVTAVYTRPDRPKGRGQALEASSVKRAALSLGLKVAQPKSLKGEEAAAELAALKPDAIVVSAYGQILPPAVLAIPRYGVLNIHPSLLPRHRGASPVAAAILAGDEFAGVSIMLLDAGLDTGPVLTRAIVPVSNWDTTATLTERLSQIGAQLLLDVLAGFPGGLTPQPQNEAEATYSGVISKEEGKIDWGLPPEDIWRRVRAYQPWPGAYTNWQGKRLKIIEAIPLPAAEKLEAGQVVALTGSQAAFGVAAGDGLLGVITLQLEGKRPTSAADFVRGQRQFAGSVLG